MSFRCNQQTYPSFLPSLLLTKHKRRGVDCAEVKNDVISTGELLHRCNAAYFSSVFSSLYQFHIAEVIL